MKAKIYIAAPSELRSTAASLKDILERKGYEITSRWIEMEDFGSTDPKYLGLWSVNDLNDVAAADTLVLINPEEYRTKGTGGRHVEFGYAAAHGIPCYIFGARTNVFHWGFNVKLVNSIDELLDQLGQ